MIAERLARRVDGLLAERVDQIRPIEQTASLLRRQPVLHERILEDLLHRAPVRVLSQHVRGDAILGRRPCEQERERVLQKAGQLQHGAIV